MSFLKGYDFVLKSRASNLHEESSNIQEKARTSPNIPENFFDPYGIRTPLELITCSRYYGTFVNNKQNIDNSIFMRLLRLFLFETRVWYLFLALSDSWLSIPTTWNKKKSKNDSPEDFPKEGDRKNASISSFFSASPTAQSTREFK